MTEPEIIEVDPEEVPVFDSAFAEMAWRETHDIRAGTWRRVRPAGLPSAGEIRDFRRRIRPSRVN